MRQKRNGFTQFMKRLDGVEDTSRFHLPRHWMPYLFIPRIKKLLHDLETTGDVGELITAFNWDGTPFEDGYWTNIYEGNTVIDREGIEYLHWLTKQGA